MSARQTQQEEKITKPIRVAYVFTGFRGDLWKQVQAGEKDGNGFWGMGYLQQNGVDANLVELEMFYPRGLSSFMRSRLLNVNLVHLPTFFAFFAYDIIYTSTGFGSQLLMTLLRFVGIRRPLWVMHDFSISGFLRHSNTLRRTLIRLITAHSDGIVTLSKKEVTLLEAEFPHLRGRIAFIPYGRDLSYFCPKSVPEVRQVFVPGSDPDRDLATVFKACEGLDVTVLITAPPSRLKKLGALPSFVRHQRFDEKDLVEEYSRSAIVVLPLDTRSGLNDAMGNSVLTEALAAGRPIIASRTNMTTSYITDGENGVLVEERNVAEMRKTIQKLFADDTLRKRLGENARTYAIQNLDARERGKELADFFKRIMRESAQT